MTDFEVSEDNQKILTFYDYLRTRQPGKYITAINEIKSILMKVHKKMVKSDRLRERKKQKIQIKKEQGLFVGNAEYNKKKKGKKKQRLESKVVQAKKEKVNKGKVDSRTKAAKREDNGNHGYQEGGLGIRKGIQKFKGRNQAGRDEFRGGRRNERRDPRFERRNQNRGDRRWHGQSQQQDGGNLYPQKSSNNWGLDNMHPSWTAKIAMRDNELVSITKSSKNKVINL